MSIHKKTEGYSLPRSPLYRLGRRKDLARLLGIKLSALESIVKRRDNLYWRKSESINGKQREIACPFGIMRTIHERLAALLNRIVQPAWLCSPRKNMTVARSVARHIDGKRFASLDVRKFYPSTSDEHIFQLFRNVFLMSDDVAGMLVKLVTIDNRAPFGSPVSPILCATAHRDVFDEIHRLCVIDGLQLSVWVDDVTISGGRIRKSLLFFIKRSIRGKGLRYHKVRRRSARRGMVVTGVYISRRGTSPGQKTRLKMKEALEQLKIEITIEGKLKIIRSLLGLNSFMASVYAEGDARRQRLNSQRQWLHTQRRKLESAVSEQRSALGRSSAGTPSEMPQGSHSPF